MVSALLAGQCAPSQKDNTSIRKCAKDFPSSLALTEGKPVSAARSAEARKNHMYEGLSDRYIFQMVTVETSDVIGSNTETFIACFGHMATTISNVRRDAEFLQKAFVTFFCPWKQQICCTYCSSSYWGFVGLSVNCPPC